MRATARNKFGGGAASLLNYNGRTWFKTPPAGAPQLYQTDITLLPKAQQDPMAAALLDPSLSATLRSAIEETIEVYGNALPPNPDDVARLAAYTAGGAVVVSAGVATAVGASLGGLSLFATASTAVINSIFLGTAAGGSSLIITTGANVAGIAAYGASGGMAAHAVGGAASLTFAGGASGTAPILALSPLTATGVGVVAIVAIAAASYGLSRWYSDPSEHGIVFLIASDGNGVALDDDLEIQRRRASLGGAPEDWAGLGAPASSGRAGAYWAVANSNLTETRKTWIMFEPLNAAANGMRQYAFRVKRKGAEAPFGADDRSAWVMTLAIRESDFTQAWFDADGDVQHVPAYIAPGYRGWGDWNDPPTT